MLESLMLGRDDWWGSDLWDRVRPQSQETGMYPFIPPSVASDRRHGDNWPFYRNEQELAQLRQRSRVVSATGGYGEGLLRNLVNYAVGSGWRYEVLTKESLPDADEDTPGHQSDRRLEQGVAAVQDWLDRWLEKTSWNGVADPGSNDPLGDSMEAELCSRVLQDGEAFLRLYEDDDGYLCPRFIEPEQIANPPGSRPEAGWTWGIRHQMDPFEDIRRVLGYHVAWMDQTTAPDSDSDTVTGTVVAADEMVHVKAPGTRSTVKRGRPFFSYDTAAALERAGKLQGNASWGAAIRAATAEIWQHAHGTADQIGALAQGLAERTRTNPVSGATERFERMAPGGIRRIPQGQELVPQPPDNTPSYLQGVQGDLRQAATAACAPEYLASGDASNANFSSTKEAGTPFVRFVESLQGLLKAAFLRVIWKALRYAAAKGLLPRRLLGLIDVQAEPPQVVQRDALELAQEDQILVGLGAKSQKTAALERGLDWEIEQANLQEFQSSMGPALPELDMPGADPSAPGGGGGGGGAPEASGAVPAPGADGQSAPLAQPEEKPSLRDLMASSKAVADLQHALYAGELPRAAVVANAVAVLGFDPQTAERLFPPVAPVKLQPDGVAGGPQPPKPPGAGGPPGTPPGPTKPPTDEPPPGGSPSPKPSPPSGGGGSSFEKPEAVSEGRWVTMPANGEDGGGTPAYIDDAGNIAAGPEKLVGKSQGEPAEKGKGDDKPKPKPAEKSDKEKPAAKSEKKKPAASGDGMSGHPLGGEKEKALAKLLGDGGASSLVGAAAKSANPLGYDTKAYPAGVDGPKLAADVGTAITSATAANAFARPTIRDVYNKVKADHPGLNYFAFQSSLAKMHADGAVRLRPYTTGLAQHPSPQHLMPFDHAAMWYVDARK